MRLGDAENQDGESGESRCITFCVGERDFLVARFDVEVGAANFCAAHFASDRDRKRSGGARGTHRRDGCGGGAGVSDDNDRVTRAERDRMIHEFEGLLEVRPDATGGEFAHPKFCDLCGVERCADADERDSIFFGGFVGGAIDRRALREHFFDERGLRVDCVVEIVGMGCAGFRHLLFLPAQCIR